MWKCHKCGKPVFFAERKQSLGYDWHPECLRCEECGKRLNPGQHAEHKGVPYCHVPCYGALFGPQLFGHGTRVESHKSYGAAKTGFKPPGGQVNGPALPRDHLESKLKVYNQFYDNKSLEIRSREVNNRLILEGALRVYWGVQGVIHLKEDDDQRTFIVRKRNSCRVSKAADDSSSDKENEEASESVAPLTTATTTGDVDPISTDVSLSESMTFDSCSLNEISELPTTPEDASANTTPSGQQGQANQVVVNGLEDEDTNTTTESSSTLVEGITSSTSCASITLPSKLDKLEKLDWDDIDELLQVERRHNDKDKIYETMPVKLPSSSSLSSSDSSPTKTSTDSTTTTTSSTSTDNFMTATGSLTSNTNTQNTTTVSTTNTTLDTSAATNYETSDDATLKPMDFEDFKRSVHQDYVNGANSFQEPNEGTLKRNQPIDPSRIHDSLKLYGENSVMSKSFNCEHALRSIDPSFINDTIHLRSSIDSPSRSSQRKYALQKSGSASAASTTASDKQAKPSHQPGRQLFEKGINRSKSGPSCFVYSDSDDDDDATLRPQRLATIRRSDVPPRYIQIQMNCYPKKKGGVGGSECESLTNSGAVAGDELTQTEELYTATEGKSARGDAVDAGATEPGLHVTEDGVVLRRPPRSGAAAIKRRSGNRRSRTKLKRRCSINGHYYNRETSFFTPPYGSQMSVWVSSLVTTPEVINLVLEKYKVDSPPENFSLFIVRDNGEQKRLRDDEYPLITRVTLGPHEDVARLFLVDARKTDEISNEVAQFLNLSLPECRAILDRYDQEVAREVAKIKERFAELRRRIVARMESLKVHL
ncbi:serine-rich adhesin for platelets [Drosophila tropicalis]|uniref:serine-rich adhesin for platelets n=1 Tax=Drosophila tropicalis TaxID=46794 RepID=UPI0035AC13F6